MEVRSETGIMSSREPFTVNLQSSPVQSQPSMQNMRLTFGPDGTAIYKHVSSTSPSPPPPTSYQGGGGGGGGSSGRANDSGVAQPIPASHGLSMNMGDQMKRKRGRPRKYGPDGAMSLALSPVPSASAPLNASTTATGGGGFSSPVGALNMATSQPASVGGATMKKARGRPPGSGRKQQIAALGSAGTGFTPHIITVKAGEDVSSMIMSFLQHGPRAVCILSANGAISNVTLRQPAMSGGTVTYEGRFEILSLSGSFLLSEYGGQRSRTGGLSVSLAGPDGRVLGGGVAGILTAASPVQVVVGSFFADGKKERKRQTLEPTSIANFPPVGTTGGTGSPISRGTLSESSGGGPGSPLNQSTGVSNGTQQGGSNTPWK